MDEKAQEIFLNPPEAHSQKQKIIMTCLKIPTLRETWVACGTKYGKTLSASVAQILAGVDRPMTKWRWVAPIYQQAKIAMEDYFPKILPPSPHTKKNLSKLSYHMPAIDTRFEFWHSQFPHYLEGAAIDGYVFDEAAKMKAEIRSSARTTTTRTKGPMLFISYPQGKNWFYNGCMEAKAHMEWAFANNVAPEKIFITAPTCENPYIDPKVIEDARRELPDRLFRQFYLAEFLDDGQVFIGFVQCQWGPETYARGERQSWTSEDADKSEVVIGVDWAKQHDYTVFIAADLATRRVVAFERFHGVSYTEAVRKLAAFCKKFKSVATIRHDKTGVGVAIDDLLAHTSLPVEGITFTNKSKADMVSRLMTAFETPGLLWIPRWDTLFMELDSFDVETSALGLPIYGAIEGKHDDTVCALMLCNSALSEFGDRSYEIKFLEDMPKASPTGALELFYRDLADD